MTAHRDLKRIIRERQSKTGESYTAARVHVMHECAACSDWLRRNLSRGSRYASMLQCAKSRGSL
jgi:hypothetical protein